MVTRINVVHNRTYLDVLRPVHQEIQVMEKLRISGGAAFLDMEACIRIQLDLLDLLLVDVVSFFLVDVNLYVLLFLYYLQCCIVLYEKTLYVVLYCM